MRKYPILVLILLMIIGAPAVKAQRITVTIAGSGLQGFNGDDNSHEYTNLNSPADVCTDAANNIYFADQGNGRIRKVSAKNGMIYTVAGGGSSSADGIPATDASIYAQNIHVDATGNLYVFSGVIVRKIDAITNMITTIAGGGTSTADGIPATSASLSGLQGLAVDGLGNVFVSCNGNHLIRKISTATGNITTIAGNGVAAYAGDGGPATGASLNHPTQLCINGLGDIFFFDDSSNTFIRKISAGTGIISKVAGSGGGILFGSPALSCYLGGVSGICTDGSGNVYFNEVSCSCRELEVASDSIRAVAGNYAIEDFSDNINSLYAWMNTPKGLCADRDENIYVADTRNNRIRKLIKLTHTPSFAFGKGQFINPCPGTAMSINSQMSITDIDVSQPETWTVLSSPANGVLSGFPHTTLSLGTDTLRLTTPTGFFYTAATGFTGADSFRVRVTDGTFSDTVIVYVSVSAHSAGVISPPTSSPSPLMCVTDAKHFTETMPGGIWSMSNSCASIGATGSVIAVLTGADTIIYTVTHECVVTATFVITINAIPSAGIISGSDSLCIGSSIVLSDPAAGGVWNAMNANATVSSSGHVTGVIHGTDTITYHTSNMCGASTAVKVITIDTIPDAGSITGADSVCTGYAITLSDTIGGGIWSVSNGYAALSGPGIVNGVAQGIDTVSYTVSNTCGAVSAIFSVRVNPLPHVGAIAGGASICVGGVVVLTDTTSGGFWTQTNSHAMLSSSGVVTGLSAGIDTILYTIGSSCGSASATQEITVNPLPDAGAITGESIVCLGGTISLSDPSAGGLWSTGNGHSTVTAGGTVTGISEGTDTIAYSVTNMCGTNTATKEIVVRDCRTNVGTAPATQSIIVFPNPASLMLNIRWTSLQPSHADVFVTNVTGQVVLKSELINNGNGNGDTQLNVSDLKEGIYLVTISSGSVHFTGKLVVNK